MNMRRLIITLIVFVGFVAVAGFVRDPFQPTNSGSAGFLGLQVQGMAPRATAALGLKTPKGVLVRDVAIGGPAATAGIQHGDMIARFGRTNTQSFNALIAAVGKSKSNQIVEIAIIRDGRNLVLPVKLGTQPASWRVTKGSIGSHGEIGLTVAAITKPIRERFKYRWGINGLAVTQVNPGKPATEILKVGDVITHINLRPVWDPKQLASAINNAKKNQIRDILLLVENADGFVYSVLTVNPGKNL